MIVQWLVRLPVKFLFAAVVQGGVIRLHYLLHFSLRRLILGVIAMNLFVLFTRAHHSGCAAQMIIHRLVRPWNRRHSAPILRLRIINRFHKLLLPLRRYRIMVLGFCAVDVLNNISKPLRRRRLLLLRLIPLDLTHGQYMAPTCSLHRIFWFQGV